MSDPVTSASVLEAQGRFREAFCVLLGAARAGNARAFLNLGYFYGKGLGVRRSRSKELYWYRRAAAGGSTAAMHNIGIVYRDRGYYGRAVRWLRKAVALGDTGSNLELGQILLARFGQCEEALACFRAVTQDEAEATIEAAVHWAAIVESMLAGRDAA